jgi:hypothetical protein
MKPNYSLDAWLFDVTKAPLFAATVGPDGKPNNVPVFRRNALIASDTGDVVGIVGNDYRLFTNREALDLCRGFCRQAFPDTKDSDWMFAAAHGPASRSRVAMDLFHQSCAIHFAGGFAAEAFTPFVRITNSYDASRAVRLDVGFMRGMCSNGMIFYEAVAKIMASHTEEGIRRLKFSHPFEGIESLTRKFESSVSALRAVVVSPDQGLEIARRVIGLPDLPEKPTPRMVADQETLDADLCRRRNRYFNELGANAYSVLNVLTDFASHPLEGNSRMRRDRPTLQRMAGRWLREFQDAANSPGFSLRGHIESLSPQNSQRRK